MQVRKLIRLLNEMVAKDPAVAYKKVCIDTRLGKDKADFFTFWEVDDIEKHQTVWQPEETENENWREVVVIGNY